MSKTTVEIHVSGAVTTIKTEVTPETSFKKIAEAAGDDSGGWASYGPGDVDLGKEYYKNHQGDDDHASQEDLALLYQHLFAFDPAGNVADRFSTWKQVQLDLTDFVPNDRNHKINGKPQQDHINRHFKTSKTRLPKDIKLGHAQLATLYHVLKTQEEIRLLSPWDLAKTTPW